MFFSISAFPNRVLPFYLQANKRKHNGAYCSGESEGVGSVLRIYRFESEPKNDRAITHFFGSSIASGVSGELTPVLLGSKVIEFEL